MIFSLYRRFLAIFTFKTGCLINIFLNSKYFFKTVLQSPD